MSSLENLPAYLRKYVVTQNYDKYSAVEHATWRYIMRQSRSFFAKHAVPVYLKGLEQTGIPVDRIPRISEMDEKLEKFGWGAVGVEGFIPSSVFLDLLARGVMPIASDMRTLDHVGYTPAPDIVHEAAGHAPILADQAFREFLGHYAHMAYRALISAEDIRQYEAIRYLSDIKENPDISPEEIVRAERRLEETNNSMTYLSEAGKVARMAWWTIEYGLTGDLLNPKIYGAGLLSSITESSKCLSDAVRKIPLSVDCINQTYDITEPQPQLYVTPSLEYLPEVLQDLESTFAFKRGGKFALEQMQRAETVNSIQFESGLSLSGILANYAFSDKFGAEFVELTAEGQLAIDEVQLAGFGREQFKEGIITPLGRLRAFPDTVPSQLSDDQLHAAGLTQNAPCRLAFASGAEVQGEVQGWIREAGSLLVIQFKDAALKFRDKQWRFGSYSLPIGEQVRSVFAGPADRDAYGDYYVGNASTSPGRKSPYSPNERRLIEQFATIRRLRESKLSNEELELKLAELVTAVPAKEEKLNWLLALEIAELAEQRLGYGQQDAPWLELVHLSVLGGEQAPNRDTAILVARGVDLLAKVD